MPKKKTKSPHTEKPLETSGSTTFKRIKQFEEKR